MDKKILKKDGTLVRKYILGFKNVNVRTFLVKANINHLASSLKTKAGFHKVRAWEASTGGNAYVTIGKKGKEHLVVGYGSGKLRQAMMDADGLNKIIEAVLAPSIPQDATHCPKCGSENVSWDRIESDGDSASQGAFCQDCDCRWATVFKFSHNEMLA